MFFGKSPSPHAEWRRFTRDAGTPPPVISRSEALRLVVMLGFSAALLGGFLSFAGQLQKQRVAEHEAAKRRRDAPSDVRAATGTGALDPETGERLEAMRSEWERLRREAGLPVDLGAAGFAEATVATRTMIDHGLLFHVEDGTEERERAPYFHLLRYATERTHEELTAEADREASFTWVRKPAAALDAKLAAAKALRGTVVSVTGKLLDITARAIEDERSPRPIVWDAIIADKDRNVFLAVIAEKTDEALPGRDIVTVSGPFFKLLRVETQDPDPEKRYRGFPTLVAKTMRRFDVQRKEPPLFATPFARIILGAAAVVLAGLGLQWLRARGEAPVPPRKRSVLPKRRGKGSSSDAATPAPPPAPAASPEASSEGASAVPPAATTPPDAAPPAPAAPQSSSTEAPPTAPAALTTPGAPTAPSGPGAPTATGHPPEAPPPPASPAEGGVGSPPGA